MPIQISKKAYKDLCKKKGVKSISRLSSKEFRELQQASVSNSSCSNGVKSFSFEYNVEVIEDGYKITLTGVHLSKNRFDSLSFREKLRYKEAIKKASRDYWMQHRSFFRKLSPMKKAIISFEPHNPRKRDHDAYSETFKRFQDTLVTLGFIKDDDQDCLRLAKNGVNIVTSKEYKVIIYIREEK